MRDSPQEYFQKGATGVLPLAEVQGKNLAATAQEIFSPRVYFAFIAGGVMVSLVTSLNAIFAYGIYSSWGFIGTAGWVSLALYTALLIVYAYLRAPYVNAEH